MRKFYRVLISCFAGGLAVALSTMTLIEVVALAVIQGLTEFLPVSSSGHLLAARFLFGISDDNGAALDAFLHVGTLGAVLVYYWRTWGQLFGSLRRGATEATPSRRLLAALAVATVPGAVAGYTMASSAAFMVRTPLVLAGSLVFTGVVLMAAEVVARRERTIDTMRLREAGLIGLAQVLALMPGVSRSGMTIAAGRSLGLARREAATFSFLMSAPIIAGAGLHSVAELLTLESLTWWPLLVGLVVAFGSGLLAIHWFLNVVERVSLKPFAVYVWFLAIVVALYAG